MSSLATKPQIEFVLLALNGADRGAQFKLIGNQISIGRGSENNIVIKDDNRVSRNHAIIELTARGVEISDVSDRNKLIVDGEEIPRTVLNNGSIIQLGDTKFQFKVIQPQRDSMVPSTSSRRSELDSHAGRDNSSIYSSSKRNGRGRPGRKSPLAFYLTAGIVMAVFLFLLFSKGTKKAEVPIRTDDHVNTEIEDNRKLVERKEAERASQGLNTRQFEEAQPNFIKGFRDYRKGQYERAIESFQACLALFPNHIQCRRYMNLSQKKFDELVQYHMVLANKYRAQNQFAACKASYRNAMVMIRNPSNKTYLEAKSGFDACDALEGDRY